MSEDALFARIWYPEMIPYENKNKFVRCLVVFACTHGRPGHNHLGGISQGCRELSCCLRQDIGWMEISRGQGTLITVLYYVTLYIESLARTSSIKYANWITRAIYY